MSSFSLPFSSPVTHAPTNINILRMTIGVAIENLIWVIKQTKEKSPEKMDFGCQTESKKLPFGSQAASQI